MTIRDDLRSTIRDALADPAADSIPGFVADAVLEWLGNLDPDADPELIAWHLRENANEIEQLRAIAEAEQATRDQEWLSAIAEMRPPDHCESVVDRSWRAALDQLVERMEVGRD